MIRRTAVGLLALALVTPCAASATTAPSLSDRIHVDGVVGDIAADEWILDATSPFPEPTGDSRWGRDADVVRVALTWDDARVYVAVEVRAIDASVLVMLGGGAGGLSTLDATGELRRAVTPPFETNILALAMPGAEPLVARADDAHPFALVDRAAVPAVMRVAGNGEGAFEMAVPWSMLALDRPVRLVVVTTGGVGTGAGDAAPDPLAVLSTDRNAPAVLGRWIEIDADANGDGVPDAGVSPRAIATVEPGTQPSASRDAPDLVVTPDRKSFAPDLGESTTFILRLSTGAFDGIAGRCTIHTMDGRAVRTLSVDASAGADARVSWDGRDTAGRIVDGGVYIAAFDVDVSAGGGRRREHHNVGVAVVR